MSRIPTRNVRRRWRWRLLERLVAWALYRMVVLAAADGDRHEVNHIDAQSAVAETSRCGPDCLLRTMPVRGVTITPQADAMERYEGEGGS
jgi:hypothetical protein